MQVFLPENISAFFLTQESVMSSRFHCVLRLLLIFSSKLKWCRQWTISAVLVLAFSCFYSCNSLTQWSNLPPYVLSPSLRSCPAQELGAPWIFWRQQKWIAKQQSRHIRGTRKNQTFWRRNMCTLEGKKQEFYENCRWANAPEARLTTQSFVCSNSVSCLGLNYWEISWEIIQLIWRDSFVQIYSSSKWGTPERVLWLKGTVSRQTEVSSKLNLTTALSNYASLSAIHRRNSPKANSFSASGEQNFT